MKNPDPDDDDSRPVAKRSKTSHSEKAGSILLPASADLNSPITDSGLSSQNSASLQNDKTEDAKSAARLQEQILEEKNSEMWKAASIERLRETLQCPVCFELPTESVFQCRDGHNICHRCNYKVSFAVFRNTFLSAYFFMDRRRPFV